MAKPTAASVNDQLEEFSKLMNSTIEALVKRIEKLESERVFTLNVQQSTPATQGRTANPRGEDNLTDRQRAALQDCIARFNQANRSDLVDTLTEQLSRVSAGNGTPAAINTWVGKWLNVGRQFPQVVSVSDVPAAPVESDNQVPSPTDDVPF